MPSCVTILDNAVQEHEFLLFRRERSSRHSMLGNSVQVRPFWEEGGECEGLGLFLPPNFWKPVLIFFSSEYRPRLWIDRANPIASLIRGLRGEHITDDGPPKSWLARRMIPLTVHSQISRLKSCHLPQNCIQSSPQNCRHCAADFTILFFLKSKLV